ncbi:hypothetical protein D3C83_146770 [compost metagenome]
MMNTPKYRFECGKLRLDDLGRRKIQRIESLQAVSGNGEYGEVGFPDAALRNEFLSHRDRNAARRLRE